MPMSRIAAIACGLMVGAAPALGQPSFYEGKTIALVVGTAAGGGYDIYGRSLARHIGRHIPGNPTIIVQNMPGAGSGKAAEFMYTHAPKDGATIGLIFPGIVMEPLLQPGKFRFDPTKFEYLGSADSGVRLCVTHRTSKIKSMEDVLKMPSTFGGSSVGSSTTDYAQLLINLAGAKIKIVNGYKSSNDTVFAMERAEVDGICGYDSSSFKAQKPDWYDTAEAHMILQASLEPSDELTKLGVPSIWKYITGDSRKIAEVVIAQQEFHRPFLLPPGVPTDRIATLRRAFDATMRDPEFLADAARMKLSITPKDAATVTKLIMDLYAAPKDLIAQVNKALKPAE